MDVQELMSLVKMLPPRRPQGLGQVWPGHGLPTKGSLDHPYALNAPWDNYGNDVPSQLPPTELPMPQRLMTPEVSARVPHVPTVQQIQPAFNPGLRIGTNEAAQRASAAREGRAADLMRLLDAYDVMPGQEKWF